MRVFQQEVARVANAQFIMLQLFMNTRSNWQADAPNPEAVAGHPYLRRTNFVEARSEPQETTTR